MKTVIVEKEEAGRKIAEVLIPNFEEVQENGVTIFKKDDTVIIPARGHIINPTINGLRRIKSLELLPIANITWKIHKSNKARTDLMKQYLKQSNEFIVASDWDREGEVIGYSIIKFALDITNPQQIKRAYYSALRSEDILDAFNNAKTMNEALLTQGLARNLADLIIGLNLTKALTLKFKEKHTTLGQAISLGRVQSPLLGYVKTHSGVNISEEPYITEGKETPTKQFFRQLMNRLVIG